MHILIGMAVVTLLIIGCFYGNLFVCVFLSLLPAAYVFFSAVNFSIAGKMGTDNVQWGIACIVLICVIWTPRWLRLRAPVYKLELREYGTPESRAAALAAAKKPRTVFWWL